MSQKTKMVKNKSKSSKLLYFSLLVIFIFAFMLHWHSIDVCANASYMNAVLEHRGIKVYESNVAGQLLEPVDCYRRGLVFSMFSVVGLSLLAVVGGIRNERK